jgi:hypothetical protein
MSVLFGSVERSDDVQTLLARLRRVLHGGAEAEAVGCDSALAAQLHQSPVFSAALVTRMQ